MQGGGQGFESPHLHHPPAHRSGPGTLSAVSDTLRVILEVGKKERRVVGGAMDWPGLDRWGRTDDDAIARLTSYLPRYAAVAERAGRAEEVAGHHHVEVVERVPGLELDRLLGHRPRARRPLTPSAPTPLQAGSPAGRGRSSS